MELRRLRKKISAKDFVFSFRYFSSFKMTLSHLVEAECVGEAENPEEVEPLLERPLAMPLVITI